MDRDSVVEKSSKIDENLKAKEDKVRRSITNITEAVSTVVSHSTNDDFRQKCFSLMKVPNSSGLASNLSSQLHTIARQHMGVTWSAESAVSELSHSSEKPTPTKSQTPSSQLVDQHATPAQSMGPCDATFNDDFGEFSHVDFFDDAEITGLLETFPVSTEEEAVSMATSSVDSIKSVEVLQSSLGDDWFDEVLDSDLFLNES